ncbi:MAG: MarR family winged helix-turn-helix transcriptional regulator [Steroidobacteraceae bacterium]
MKLREITRSRERRETQALLAARTLVDRMRALYRELERMTGAPISLHRALTSIGEEPGMTASRLAHKLGMQRPAISHVLKSMAERGWIERKRHDTDQRSVRLHVTAGGRQTLGKTSGRAVGTLQRAVGKLSDRDLGGLASGLEALLQNLSGGATSAPRQTELRRHRPAPGAMSASRRA